MLSVDLKKLHKAAVTQKQNVLVATQKHQVQTRSVQMEVLRSLDSVYTGNSISSMFPFACLK